LPQLLLVILNGLLQLLLDCRGSIALDLALNYGGQGNADVSTP
jgi:hypothetical protein